MLIIMFQFYDAEPLRKILLNFTVFNQKINRHCLINLDGAPVHWNKNDTFCKCNYFPME